MLLRARSRGFNLGYAPQRALFGCPGLIILPLFQLCLHLSGTCLKRHEITTDLVFFLTSARSALDQLFLSDETWLRLALEIQASTLQAVGAMARLRRYGTASGRRWIRGSGELARIFNAT